MLVCGDTYQVCTRERAADFQGEQFPNFKIELEFNEIAVFNKVYGVDLQYLQIRIPQPVTRRPSNVVEHASRALRRMYRSSSSSLGDVLASWS